MYNDEVRISYLKIHPANTWNFHNATLIRPASTRDVHSAQIIRIS